MADGTTILLIGQQVSIPGHFDVPVVLEAARPLGKGFECRVRLPDGSLDDTVISEEEAQILIGDSGGYDTTTIFPADADQVRLLIESTRIRLASGTPGDGNGSALRVTAWARTDFSTAQTEHNR
jgi:hypothetical protein